MNKKGMLVVFSAPSGCGKDTVFKELCKLRGDIVESISATTRAPREGEKDGVNYFFKTEEEFKRLINSQGLLEYTVYNGCYYGTPIEGVNRAIEDGKICFLIIEVE
jgi:guanylate kinase